MFLTTLTDKQLVRLFNNILVRIQEWGSGGSSFGVDYPTLHYCQPGLALAYVQVKAEGRRRGL